MLFIKLAFALSLTYSAQGDFQISALKGLDVVTQKKIEIHTENKKKGVVIVFMSSLCPCSNSHTTELSSLSKDFPEFTFLGVHSNPNESDEITASYFKKVALPFSVIDDKSQVLADQLNASKTPHAFLLSLDGKILYKGGVTDSSHFDKAQKKYLRIALEEMMAGKPISQSETRTLGCVIARKQKNVW